MNSANVIRIGSRVRVRDGDADVEFDIVDPAYADAACERLSVRSPLGSALLGRRAGDQVTFRAPDGVLAVTVVDVR
jgi:transcription elongation GreA/GreB family factor